MNFHNIQFTKSYGTGEQLERSTYPEIVFSGRSNVGKSTLINKIFNRKGLARVSSVPGKTVTINFFECDKVHFVDLPGYGYAKKSAAEMERWSEMIESFFSSSRNIALVFQLIDFRRKAENQDLQMLDYLTQRHIPFVIVFTKCDKLNKTQTLERMRQIEQELAAYDADAILFSALNSQGVEDVKRKIIEITEAL